MLVQTQQVRSADDFPVSNKMLLFGNECANDKDFLKIMYHVSAYFKVIEVRIGGLRFAGAGQTI